MTEMSGELLRKHCACADSIPSFPLPPWVQITIVPVATPFDQCIALLPLRMLEPNVGKDRQVTTLVCCAVCALYKGIYLSFP